MEHGPLELVIGLAVAVIVIIACLVRVPIHGHLLLILLPIVVCLRSGAASRPLGPSPVGMQPRSDWRLWQICAISKASINGRGTGKLRLRRACWTRRARGVAAGLLQHWQLLGRSTAPKTTSERTRSTSSEKASAPGGSQW